MSDLLSQLAALLSAAYVNVAPWNVKAIKIAGDFELTTATTNAALPVIVLTPIGETEVSGPMGNTRTVTQTIRVRLIMWSSKPNTKREGVASIYDLSDAVRATLASSKQLGKVGNYLKGLDAGVPTADLDFIGGANYVGRDLTCSWSRMELWTGNYNPQATLALPG